MDGDLIEKAVDTGAFLHFNLKDPGLTEQVVEDLQDFYGCYSYAKEDIPDHLYFRDHEFILDILVVCEEGRKVDSDGEYRDAFFPDPGETDGREETDYPTSISSTRATPKATPVVVSDGGQNFVALRVFFSLFQHLPWR